MTKDRIEDRDRIEIEDCIDEADRALNPIGRFFRHNAMHAGTTRMLLDEFGRCARCAKLGVDHHQDHRQQTDLDVDEEDVDEPF
jgi:hypothetical protein